MTPKQIEKLRLFWHTPDVLDQIKEIEDYRKTFRSEVM